jgi:hypothetical protein
MAEKKTNKPKTKKPETNTNTFEVPTLRNPLKTWWGKTIVVVLVLGMIILPFIALIIMLIERQ